MNELIRVLIIDDSKVVRKMLAHTLESECENIKATEYDPAQGYPAPEFAWNNYDIILLDYDLGLPDDDGLVWLSKFRSTQAVPPVVMISDDEQPTTIVQSVKLGAQNYILKRELRNTNIRQTLENALGKGHVATIENIAHIREDAGNSRRIIEQAQDEGAANHGHLSAAQMALTDTNGLVVMRRNETLVSNVSDKSTFQVPGYKLISQIAKGGMTTIFLAQRLEDDLRVVLKLLYVRDAKEQQMIKYFMQEHALISRIDHPSVIKIFERAFAKDFAYIALEYLAAGDLTARIKRGMLTPDRAVEILKQLAEGLEVIHELGIVHRDLKPGNILFRHNDTIAISDFGVAHVANATSGIIDESEILIGTPPYMSPEQCEGRPIDSRSDLYSLGIIFFEMLTGQRPYNAKSVATIVNAHLHEPIPRLPAEIATYQPIIDGLLAKDATERFQTASEVQAGLEWVR